MSKIKTSSFTVFIDCVQVNARSMSSNGKYMTMDADGLPVEGRHLVRVVNSGNLEVEVYCEALLEFNDWSGKWETRFYLQDRPRLKHLDKQDIVL